MEITKFEIICPYCNTEGAKVVIKLNPRRKITVVRCLNKDCNSIQIPQEEKKEKVKTKKKTKTAKKTKKK